MNRSADLLINRLLEAIDSGTLKKVDILRKSKMLAAQLEAYLQKKSTPGLDVADRLAEALEQPLHRLIDPGTPFTPVKEHDLEECYRRVGQTLGLNEGKQPSVDVPDDLSDVVAALKAASPGQKKALRAALGLPQQGEIPKKNVTPLKRSTNQD